MGATMLFRCDASPAIGAGHVARCLALADVFAAFGYRIVFAMREPTRDFLSALSRVAIEVIDLTGAVETEADQIAARLPQAARIAVIDHYGRDAAFETRCRHFADIVLAFDDGPGRGHDCDFLLDSAAPRSDAYDGLVPGSAQVLAGPSFALLRPSFAAARAGALARRDGRPVRSILVSMGATDPLDVTGTVLDLLASAALPEDVSATVVLSSRAPAVEKVRARARSHARLRLVTDADDMPGLMTQADLAIGAAGSTAFERACLGLPTLMVMVAENQRGIVRLMSERGAAADCGPADAGLAARLRSVLNELMADPQRRISMARAASGMVDGRGGRRVLAAIAGAVRTRDGASVNVRLAEPDDRDWLLELQRQPATRRFARQPEAPGEREHADWFARVLGDPGRLLLIVQCDGARAGMLRLDRLEDIAFEVSIAISQEQHGRGVGRAALTLARRIAATDLHAIVLPGNSASRALFLAAGYAPDGEHRYRSRAA